MPQKYSNEYTITLPLWLFAIFRQPLAIDSWLMTFEGELLRNPQWNHLSSSTSARE